MFNLRLLLLSAFSWLCVDRQFSDLHSFSKLPTINGSKLSTRPIHLNACTCASSLIKLSYIHEKHIVNVSILEHCNPVITRLDCVNCSACLHYSVLDFYFFFCIMGIGSKCLVDGIWSFLEHYYVYFVNIYIFLHF